MWQDIDADLLYDALQMALLQRQPEGI